MFKLSHLLFHRITSSHPSVTSSFNLKGLFHYYQLHLLSHRVTSSFSTSLIVFTNPVTGKPHRFAPAYNTANAGSNLNPKP